MGIDVSAIGGSAMRRASLLTTARREEAFNEWIYDGTGGTPEDVPAWLSES